MLALNHSAHDAIANAPYKTAQILAGFQTSRRGFLPYAAPSTEGFERIRPSGAPQGCGALHAGAGKPLQATPFKPEEHREKAASGPPFFWILFFGGAKKSISPVGARTDFKTIDAIATRILLIQLRTVTSELFCPTAEL